MKAQILTALTGLALILAMSQEAYLVPPDQIEDDYPQKPDEYLTTSRVTITNIHFRGAVGDPEIIDNESWPQIPPPTKFHHYFENPAKVWRIEGGYFAYFDAGEFGGALFYSERSGKSWTRVLGEHIQEIGRYTGDMFLAVGGLSHMSVATGSAYILSRNPHGTWVAKEVFRSHDGVPWIAGIGATDDDLILRGKSVKLFAICLYREFDKARALTGPFIGITSDGTIHYLGDRDKQDSGKVTGDDNRDKGAPDSDEDPFASPKGEQPADGKTQEAPQPPH